MTLVLRFGIPSLDNLFSEPGDEEIGMYLPQVEGTDRLSNLSICINGTEGAGKSILALHLASRYMADCSDEGAFLPMVLYVSTDLKYRVAEKVWHNFCLDTPNKRKIPFTQKPISNGEDNLNIPLVQCPPFQLPEENGKVKPLSHYLIHRDWNQKKPAIYFVDLASNTAGDDWGFASRVLSVMERPQHYPPHLMIIDSVEGFETLVGEHDAFGESQSRRSRIAQVMRSAADKWHIVFIVEQPNEKEHLPEEFVTDVVIDLRSILVRDYVRRTVEIVKARGQSHTRGQHTYLIRSGGGSTTGNKINHDDPKVSSDDASGYQSYVHICPSLHYLNRKIMKDRGQGRPTNPTQRFAAFGIRYLDTMLAGATDGFKRRDGDDERGLPCTTTTALIGNSQTQKSPLGIAFLCRCFRSYADRFLEKLASLAENRDKVSGILREALDLPRQPRLSVLEEWRQTIYQRLSDARAFRSSMVVGEYISHRNIENASKEKRRELLEATRRISPIVIAAALELGPPHEPDDGIPVLLTTQDIHAELLATKFLPWLLRKIPDLKHRDRNTSFGCLAALRILMEERIICRRLEIHDMPSSTLVHILQRSVETAQRLLFGKEPPELSEERFQKSWGIRVVIDDLNILRNTYIGIREDPLLLRFLIFYLGREGVTTMLIDTQEGHPDLTVASHLDSELRSLVEHHIYTWRFPFYDGNRVAIAAIPSIRPEAPTIIRELRSGTGKGTGPEAAPLVVDPHFELYSGIEKGEPQPISLEVRLFEETPAFKTYISQLNKRCTDLFSPLNKEGKAQVITAIPPEDYEMLREFAHIQRDTRLDYTLVFHVDEYWVMKRPGIRRSGAAHLQWNYLNAKTSIENVSVYEDNPERVWAIDPFGWFQPTALDKEERTAKKIGPFLNNLNNKNSDESSDKQEHPYRRSDAFVCQGYTLIDEKVGGTKELIDRIPFSWDFGFLLCRVHAWEDEKNNERKLTFLQKAIGNEGVDAKYKTVLDVWNDMPKATKDGIQPNRSRPSWRVFLEACYQLERAQTYSRSIFTPAFDLQISATPSLSCLILEIWASEIFKDLSLNGKQDSLLKLITERRWQPTGKGLISWINDYKLQLFKSWLLLVEVLNLQDLAETINEGSLRLREPNPATIAVRHWYKTACRFTENLSIDDPVVPVGLPGHFSVRGDWFLAVAGSSRSERLADQVLDFLNTRSSNYERLHYGLGLPVRRIITEMLRTSILTFDRGDKRNIEEIKPSRRVSKVLYENLIRLGGPVETTDDSREPHLKMHYVPDNFFWFWRSGLAHFFHHSKIWHEWLCQTIIWWNRMREVDRDNWVNGFERYDRINSEYHSRRRNKESLKIRAWELFDQHCDHFIKELKQATPLEANY